MTNYSPQTQFSTVRYFAIFLSIFISNTAVAQKIDTNYLKALYDRCLEFDENKADSVAFYAQWLATKANQIHYDRAEVLVTRLMGIHYDLKGDYDSAIVYYFKSLEAANNLKAANYKISALTDLAYVYVNTKQPVKAKDMYLEVFRLTSTSDNIVAQINAYLNLGAIYNLLKLSDSALYFLEIGLQKALQNNREQDAASFYNNIGNAYFEKMEFSKSLEYFQKNLRYHQASGLMGDQWRDNLNIADALIGIKNFRMAQSFADTALSIALQLAAKSKEADSYGILSKLYFNKGDYKKAYEYQQKWYALDTSLVNEHTNGAIAGLQERFNAKQRAQDNIILQAEIAQAHFKNQLMGYTAFGAGMVALLVAFLLLQKRLANKRLQKQNELINRQNQKLADLNFEKNALLSIVSHDLSTPFASIKMWSQILESEPSNLTQEQLTAIQKINDSTGRGENLIRTILDIEKAETNLHKIQLDQFDLNIFARSMVVNFEPIANGKNIKLQLEPAATQCLLVSDTQLLARIFENLLSNAVKYAPPASTVWITIQSQPDKAIVKIKDEGAGIDKNELPLLFSKYGKLSSRPTNGEASTGLGLTIVKRIVDELNGKVYCVSEKGKGAEFIVELKN